MPPTRTPSKSTVSSANAVQHSPKQVQKTLLDFGINNPQKRRYPDGGYDEGEITLESLARMMQGNHVTMLADSEARSAKSDRNFADLRSDITQQFNAVNSRVDRIESSVAQTSSHVSQLQRKFEMLEQEKLSAHMTISGVNVETIAANQTDLRKYALDLIRTFNVSINPCDVVDVFALNVFEDKQRLVVVFRTAAAKVEVMKKKREAKDPRKIFFDHRMTPATSKLYHHARRHAKQVGGRAFLYGHAVYYENESKEKKRIDFEHDLPVHTPPNPIEQ